MARRLIVASAILRLSLVLAGGASAARGDWPQFHFSAAKSGWNPAERILSAANVGGLVERWHANGEGVGSPLAVGPRVFAVADDKLVALRRSDGAMLWSSTLPDFPVQPPGALASGRGLVLVVAGGQLQARRQRDGMLVWSAAIGSSRGPTVAGGRVYAGSADHHLYAFELATGRLRWRATIPDEIQSIVAVADGRVFAASMDGRLSAFRASTGSLRWTATGIGQVFGGGPAVLNDTVSIAADAPSEGSGQAELLAFRASNGHELWRAPAGDDVHSVPAVDRHTVYIGAIDGSVRAVSARTGRQRWQVSLGGGEVWASIAVANGVIYLTTDNGRVYALDAATGATLWSDTPAPTGPFATLSSPAVAGGVVYVGFGGAGIRAYGLTG